MHAKRSGWMAGRRSSHVDVTYTCTALAEGGNIFIDACTEQLFRRNLKHWEDSMNYYLETGGVLKANGG